MATVNHFMLSQLSKLARLEAEMSRNIDFYTLLALEMAGITFVAVVADVKARLFAAIQFWPRGCSAAFCHRPSYFWVRFPPDFLGACRFWFFSGSDVAEPASDLTPPCRVVTVRSCRYGAVLRACQMAIDADLNGVIANVGNGVGHWKRMATRLARTLAEPQARSGTGRTERRAVATSGPKYRHDRTVTNART